MTYRTFLHGALLLAVLSPAALAQWSADAATNLAVADGAEAEVQPKVVPTADGGVYISWFEGSGFDVRIQKLDASGNNLFATDGLLVADRGFSSTQDYGLSVDASGNALLTFRDDRGSGIDITATLVTPTGTQPWGPNGVQLTSTTDFLGAPKIAGTSDGSAIVAWSQNETTRLQKLDANGVPQWTNDVVLTPSAGFYFTSDLQGSGTGAIVSIHHQTGGFSSPRHLLAQKFDADGTALWGTAPLAVFDSGSLQIGNFPPFVTDGSGGAVFSWYSVSAGLQVYVQRVLSDGTEAFAHNGLLVSTNGARERVAPDAAFDADTDELYVFWIELANAQSMQGIYGQKFDASGSRRWTDDGVEIEALANVGIGSVQTVLGGPGAFAFWDSAPSFGQDQLFGANASGDASSTIDVFGFDVSTTPGSKSRLVAVNSTDGFEVVVWQDERAGNADVYAQNVNADGSLGTPAITLDASPDTQSVAQGGVAAFSYTVTNNTGAAQSGVIFYEVFRGATQVRGPVQVRAGTLNPGQTLTAGFSINVPGNAPADAYGVEISAGPNTGHAAITDIVAVTVTATNRPAGTATAWALAEADPWPTAAAAKAAADAGAYPNPFARSTEIAFALDRASDVSLVVYDVRGREVAPLADGPREAGTHRVTFDATNLPSGVYLYRLTAGATVETGRITLVK